MTNPRARAMIRDALIVGLIVAGLFVAIEGAVSTFWPQKLATDYLGGPSIAVLDARLGHRLRPNARSRTIGPEFDVGYRISAQGLRDEVHHALPKPPDTTRVLVLGDSFTYGTGSAYEALWPTLLERTMQDGGYRVEVVKAGVPMYDTRSEALYLERAFSIYDPDIVLLAFTANDLFTNMPVKAEGTAEAHLSPTEGINDKDGELHSLILAKRILMASDWLYARLYALTRRHDYFASPPSATLRRQIEVTKGLFERVQGFCRQSGCELMVLSVPQQFQVLVPGRGEALGVDVMAIDEIFGRFAEERGFTWLPTLSDLRAAYRADGKDLYFRFDGHLNHRGHGAVAEILAPAFVARFADQLSLSPPSPAGSV